MNSFGKPRPFGRTNTSNNSNANNTPQSPPNQHKYQAQAPQPAGFVRPSYLPSDEQVGLRMLDEEANPGFNARGNSGGQQGSFGGQQGRYGGAASDAGFGALSGGMPAYSTSEPATDVGHPAAARMTRDVAIARRLQEEHDADIARQMQEEEGAGSGSFGGFGGRASGVRGTSTAGPSSEMGHGAGGFRSGPSRTFGGVPNSPSFGEDAGFRMSRPPGAASSFRHPSMPRVILVPATGPSPRLPLLLSSVPHPVFHETGLPEGSEDGSWGTYNGDQQMWGSPLGVAFSSEPLWDIQGLVLRQVSYRGQLWYKFEIDARW